jgi:diaminohydroxyphosphoribosylaminopyrimidine deaminase/5-amino-6-(5-phosphoribosylamino)uracil reductase
MTNKEAIEYCIKLAKNANEREISPNPYVGAIVIDKNGQIKGEGCHQRLGGAHAEVFAINAALANQTDLSTSTLYVSLEPCSHFGKTPPCCDLIIQHQIQKVVIGSLDPNPKVDSIEKLKNAGIQVEVEIDPDATELNRRFFTQHLKQRPYFILKTASTIDGKIADRNENSKWISNEFSRQFVHTQLRSNVDAILTTYKTIIKDEASLTIRIDGEPIKETNVVIIDKELSLLNAEYNKLPIFYNRSNSKIYFITDKKNIVVNNKSIELIEGVFNDKGLVFDSITKQLLEKRIYTILTEAGNRLNANLIDQRMADELYWFIAPKILNDLQGISMFGNNEMNTLATTYNLELVNIEKFDQDLLVHYNLKHELD